MKFEGISEHLNKEVDDKRNESISTEDVFRARNEMQIKLATRFYGFEIENEQFGEWIKNYSTKFSDILDEHTEFLFEYMKGDTDKSVDKMAELLYEKHGVHN